MPISVIMPAHNAASYVESAIASILDQTYRDIELIVVDDGSTDETSSIVDRLALHDSRVVAVHQPNGGAWAARNSGLERARGDLVAWQDPDDLSAPNRLELLLAALHSADADYAHCDALLIDERGAPIGYQQSRPVRPDELLPFMLTTGTPFCNPSLLVPRERFDGVRCADLSIGEDTDLAARVTAGRRGAHVPQPLYLHRRSSGSGTLRGASEDRFEALGELLKWATPFDLVPEARWSEASPSERLALARSVIGLKLVRRGDKCHAEEQFNAMMTLLPDLRPGVQAFAAGLVKLAGGKLEEAEALLRAADGPSTLLAIHRAEVLATSGRPGEAMRVASAALTATPFSVNACATLRGLGSSNSAPFDSAPRHSLETAPVLPTAGAAMAQARNAELADAQADGRAAARGAMPCLHRSDPMSDALRIVMLMPRTDACGGARIILEHANRLLGCGAEVTVLAHTPPPLWFPLRARFVEVPWGQPLAQSIPPCDVVVAGYWDEVASARRLGIAPVAHLDQGPFHHFDELDPMVERLVADALAAADITLTVGTSSKAALAERYGIESDVVPNAIDPDLFHPGPPRRSSEGRSVLFVGWDGNDFKGIDVLRVVAQGLAESHPDVRVVWATPRPPVGPPVGETVVDPEQILLAALYREASAYVGGSRFESFGLPALEAMASGTPVVSTANDGVLTYGVDGENALLAPVDDAEGLLARVRAVLDDEVLAERLRASGLATAARFSWQEIIDDVHARYRHLAAGVPVEQGAAVSLTGGSWTLARTGDDETLAGYLASCPTRHLAIPVSQPVIEGHRLVRWRTVATLEDRPEGTTRVFLPARDEAWVEDSPWQKGIELLRGGDGARALEVFSGAYVAAPSATQAVLGRWVVLALVRAGRSAVAQEVSAKMAAAYPAHPDYFYLAALAYRTAGVTGPMSELLRATEVLGSGARYDEWFEDPHTLTRVAIGP